jgi:transposase-like protein
MLPLGVVCVMADASNPQPGIDYPRTFQEFEAWLGSEAACRAYIRQLRWPDGFVCPACGVMGDPSEMSRGLLLCRHCGRQVSLTAGTIFQDTHKPLHLWFLTMWFITSQKNGVSALGLQRVLGIGSYRTAWTWLHKLRRAMVRPGRDRLRGEVEVDETYIGAPEEGVCGRQTLRKAIVAIAVEKDGRGFGRVRLRMVGDVSADSLMSFVRSAVESGSVVQTDGWASYSGLKDAGYRHEVTVISSNPDPAHIVMPRVHKVAALLKRWLMGTLQGGVQHQHLDYYLDEFAFRFNRRRSKSRGLLFYRLAQQAVDVEPVTYRSIVDPDDPGSIDRYPWGLRV